MNKKILLTTFAIALGSVFLAGKSRVEFALSNQNYSVSFKSLTSLRSHIDQAQTIVESINQPRKTEVSNELSLSDERFAVKAVYGLKINKTSWGKFFKPLSVQKEQVIQLAKADLKVSRKPTSDQITVLQSSSAQGPSQLNTNPVQQNSIQKTVVTQIPAQIVSKASSSKKEVALDRSSTPALNQKIALEKRSSSAAVAPTTEPKVSQNNEIESDLVFFDYAQEPVVDQETPVQKKIRAFQLAQAMAPVKKQALQDVPTRKKTRPDLVAANTAATQVPGIIDSSEEHGIAPQDEIYKRVEIDDTTQNDALISAYAVNLSSGSVKDLSDFDLSFEDNGEKLDSSGSGSVEVSFLANSSLAIRRGEVFEPSSYPTMTDFLFEGGNQSITTPVLNRKGYDDFISSNGLKGLGGHVLVELNELTEDVEIDDNTYYESKIYLDKNFNKVKPEDSEYFYLLFVGVDPGNTVIYFRTLDNAIYNKIIHVADEAIYYEPNFYSRVEKDEYSLFEDNLLGKTVTALNIHQRVIVEFSHEKTATNLAPNRLLMKGATYPSGTRRYQEYKHLGESLFVGHWNQDYLDFPSEDYMRLVLSKFDVPSVSGQCLVQLNFRKPAKSFSFKGVAHKGMPIKTIILDKDGEFYRDLSAQSRKIFIMGESQGVINIEIEYADGSFDYVQSYCSRDTYLVEQL